MHLKTEKMGKNIHIPLGLMINSIISLSKIKLSSSKTYYIFILVFIHQLIML